MAFTIAHKTLHRKRPEFFPLLDNVTEQVLPYGASWHFGSEQGLVV